MTHFLHLRDLSSDKGREKRIFGQSQWVGHFAMGNPTCFHQVIMDDSFFAFARSLQRQRAGESAFVVKTNGLGISLNFRQNPWFWLLRYGKSQWFLTKEFSRTRTMHLRALRGLFVANGKVQKPRNTIHNTTLVSLKD